MKKGPIPPEDIDPKDITFFYHRPVIFPIVCTRSLKNGFAAAQKYFSLLNG